MRCLLVKNWNTFKESVMLDIIYWLYCIIVIIIFVLWFIDIIIFISWIIDIDKEDLVFDLNKPIVNHYNIKKAVFLAGSRWLFVYVFLLVALIVMFIILNV